MRSRTIIQHTRLRMFSPFLLTALLSVMILCWWLAPDELNNQDSASSVAGINEDATDAALQQAASLALGEREGTIIVMDPQNGRIRAVVNSRLAFEQALSPGSTIKPFAALTALQSGLINEDSRLLCRDRYASEGFEISCSHPKINAPFDPAQALAFSCNYYFGKLGERLNGDSFNATLLSFGFGASTNTDKEREVNGALPRGGRMKARDALGESKELLVTPIQLLTAYAALTNGGHLYLPQLATAREFNKRERARITIAPAHRALLIKGMRGSIVYGTAEHAALSRLPSYLFGKTGTATASDDLHTQGWFVGLASEPGDTRPEGVELAVLVFLRNAHGAECAENARPVFEAFIKERSRNKTTTTTRGGDAHAVSPSPASPQPPAGLQVRVHLAREDKVVTVAFEDYVLGVLATEGAVEDEPESLKALAVAVRTYASQHLKRHEREGYDFCNTTHCQRYTFLEGGEKTSARDLVRQARDSTNGEVLLDENGRAADAYFHAACGGMTANVETLWGSLAPKHLRGVRDEYCASRPNREWTDVIPMNRLAEALRSDSRTETGARLENVVVSRRDATARAELLTLEGERRRVVRGWDFKIIVGRILGWNVLKSSRFEVTRAGSTFIFRGSGFGHGVGLCQEGAHVLAQRGTPYRRILNYYFPGTSVGQREREVDLQNTSYAPHAFDLNLLHPIVYTSQNRRLSLTSEHFQLSYPASTHEREAENVLRMLEAARSDVLSRVSAILPGFEGLQRLTVIVHPTTGDFISATGQPPWAAGVTKGRRIELQPLGILRRRGVLPTTLRHEYAHAVIEALGRGRAPRWLAEGLAIHVAGEGAMFARFESKEKLSTDVLEQRLTRPASAEDMRALYVAAYRHVQALIRSEGEASVWGRVAQR